MKRALTERQAIRLAIDLLNAPTYVQIMVARTMAAFLLASGQNDDKTWSRDFKEWSHDPRWGGARAGAGRKPKRRKAR